MSPHPPENGDGSTGQEQEHARHAAEGADCRPPFKVALSPPPAPAPQEAPAWKLSSAGTPEFSFGDMHREVLHEELQKFWDSTIEPAIVELKALMEQAPKQQVERSHFFDAGDTDWPEQPRLSDQTKLMAAPKPQLSVFESEEATDMIAPASVATADNIMDDVSRRSPRGSCLENSAPIELKRKGFSRDKLAKRSAMIGEAGDGTATASTELAAADCAAPTPERDRRRTRMSTASVRSLASRALQQQQTEEELLEARLTRVGLGSSRRSHAQALGDSYCYAVDLAVGRITIEQFVHSTTFDNMAGLLIFVNTITIGIQTDYMAQNLTEDVPLLLEVVDKMLACCFLLELIARIRTFRKRFFYSQRWRPQIWNLFDLTLVVLQVFEELMRLIIRTTMSAADARSMKAMRVMRVLRLIRALRVMRMMRLLSDLRTIVASVVGSLKALGWTVLLLIMLMFVVGVYFTQAVTDSRLEEREKSWEVIDRGLVTHFSSLPRAVLSLYEVVSGGVDWGTLCTPLMVDIGPHAGLLFVVYVAFVVLCIMNVVTGVFVDSALRSAQSEDTEFMMDNLMKVFTNGDHDQNGTLSSSEFGALMEHPRMRLYLESIDLDPGEAVILYSLLDVEGSGEVNMLEFVNGCIKLRGQAKAIDLMTVLWENRHHVRSFMRHCREQERRDAAIGKTLEHLVSVTGTLMSSTRAHNQPTPAPLAKGFSHGGSAPPRFSPPPPPTMSDGAHMNGSSSHAPIFPPPKALRPPPLPLQPPSDADATNEKSRIKESVL